MRRLSAGLIERKQKYGGGAGIWPACDPKGAQYQRHFLSGKLSEKLHPGHCGYEYGQIEFIELTGYKPFTIFLPNSFFFLIKS